MEQTFSVVSAYTGGTQIIIPLRIHFAPVSQGRLARAGSDVWDLDPFAFSLIRNGKAIVQLYYETSSKIVSHSNAADLHTRSVDCGGVRPTKEKIWYVLRYVGQCPTSAAACYDFL